MAGCDTSRHHEWAQSGRVGLHPVLIAAQRVFTCTEAATCQPAQAQPPAHDAFTRLLSRQPPDTAALWREVKPLLERQKGALLLDDSTLDKPYARHMALVHPVQGQPAGEP